MAENTQLFRINVPNLTDATADTWATLFDKINNNFEKIASLPFLQGVKGDSFQLTTKHIWEKNDANNKWYLTEEGALLLNAIFNTNTFISGETFETSYSHTNNYTLGNPLNSFNNTDKIKTQPRQNNDLYFYVIIDDSGIELEKKLGQIFYFVDGRLNNLQNSINSGITDFVDYSGCFNYNLEKNTFEKLDIIPTLYYDSKTQDICWQFSGTKTGIPATGAKGEDGKDSNFKIVKVNNDKDNCGEITAVLKETNPDNNQYDMWDTNLDSLTNSYACICFENELGWQIAYGYIYVNNNKKYAYWPSELIISCELDDIRINNYFARIGTPAQNQTGFRGIQIPSCPDRTNKSSYNTAHVIKTANYTNSKNSDNNDLIFRLTNNAFGSVTPTRKPVPITVPSIILDNYNLKIQKLTYNSIGIDEVDSQSASSTIGYGTLNLDGGNNSNNYIHLSATNAEFVTGKQVNFYNGICLGDDLNNDATTYAGIIFGDRDNPSAVCKYNGETNRLNFLLNKNESSGSNILNSIQIAVTASSNISSITGINSDNYADSGIIIKPDSVTSNSNFYVKKNIYANETIASSSLPSKQSTVNSKIGLPIGSIIMWYGNIQMLDSKQEIYYPVGGFSDSWAVCNGASIKTNKKFANLAFVIGDNLPDFSDKFPLGINAKSSSSSAGNNIQIFSNSSNFNINTNNSSMKKSAAKSSSSGVGTGIIGDVSNSKTQQLNGLNVYFLIKYA